MKTEIVNGYLPGAIGRITELHANYYYRHAGFGLYFEGKVASELSEFLQSYEANHDGLWLLTCDGVIEGSIVIDGAHAKEKDAHLRWFILSERLRGSGCGNALMKAAMEFCENRGYERIYLWTFDGLNAARHLYEKHGFQLAEERRGVRWGAEVNEQCFESRRPRTSGLVARK